MRKQRCKDAISRRLNREVNEALHAEKTANGGLGRRERRRIAAGIRKPAAA